ncbi:MAG: DegV family protein, partial [Lachnospiraceae bacterium]|nr:DegV family protein [Lachnospiraceae bacterium]
MSDFILTCESTADLNAEWYEKRGIRYAFFHLYLGDQEYDDNIGVSVTHQQMYDVMMGGVDVHSSQVGTAEYIDLFEPILKEGKDILHVTLAHGISGTINSANAARDELSDKYPDRRIEIVDSYNASSGFGMIMDYLADLKDGGASLDECKDWLLNNRLKFRLTVLSTDLTFLIKGGRVSKGAGAIAKVLNICPIIDMISDGTLKVVDKIRGKKKAMEYMVERMKAEAKDGVNYSGKCFLSQWDEEKANIMKDMIEETFPNLRGQVKIFPIGGTIGVHTGPGTVVVFYEGA